MGGSAEIQEYTRKVADQGYDKKHYQYPQFDLNIYFEILSGLLPL